MAKKKQPSMFPGSDRKPKNSKKRKAKAARDKARAGNRPKSGIVTRPPSLGQSTRPASRHKHGDNG